MWSAAVVEPALPGAKESGDGFSGPSGAVVDRPHERVVAVGLLPGRSRVLLVRVGGDQDPVQVQRFPAR